MVGSWWPRARTAGRRQRVVFATLVAVAAFNVADVGRAAAAPAVATAPAAPVALVGLHTGDQGPEVEALQRQLTGLGFWLGDVDGVFDDDTRHALVAFQKLAGLPRNGAVGLATQAALDSAQRPTPRSTEGHVVEIDLTHQVLMIVDQGAVTEVVDVSTGRRAGTTPVGNFAVNREIDGLRRAPLGLLYRPKYFRGGVALHGFTSVPSRPASHGCVRVTYSAMDHLWGPGIAPLGTPVLVYR
jgi:lipoprotein-anchoring transpeptidase ErfK/SrfK